MAARALPAPFCIAPRRCNHAVQPNAAVGWLTGDAGLSGGLEALCGIAPNEEITSFCSNLFEYSGKNFSI